MWRVRALAVGLSLAAILPVAIAYADPPANDNRADARAIQVGSTTEGTTVESTREEDEPFSNCGETGGSVWYSIEAGVDGEVIADLTASGDLDAIVDVYQRVRSQLRSVTCEFTNEEGQASFEFPVEGGSEYLIRVAQRPNSASDAFELELQSDPPAPNPPGRELGSNGVAATLDRAFRPQLAYSRELREGVSYRVNMTRGIRNCMSLQIFPPGTSDFDSDDPVRTFGCGGYELFTPRAGQSGRYSFVVNAARRTRGAQPFRLHVAAAGRDDTLPGIFIRNYDIIRGGLAGNGADVVDLYRFDVEERSALALRLRSDQRFQIILIGFRGRRLARTRGPNETLSTRVARGRYFVAIRAGRRSRGNYTLRRVSRTITNTRVSFNRSGNSEASPGESVRIGATVRPGVNGPVAFVVERFDPVSGWQFHRRFRQRAVGGAAAVSFRPPSVGRYRVRAFINGTRSANPSQTGYAYLSVVEPIG